MTPDPPQLVTVDATTTATVRGVVATAELAGFFDRAFTALNEVLAAQGVAPVGPAFGLYRGPLGETADVEVGFPVDGAVRPERDVRPSTLPGGRVARLVHAGGFDGLSTSWERLGSWIAERGLTPGEVVWEVYLTEPSPKMDPDELRTQLNWPVAP